ARDFNSMGFQSFHVVVFFLVGLYEPGMVRGAYLAALFVLLTPTGAVYQSTGRGGVTLALAPRGTYSAGFDTLFEAENGLTLAEMPMAERVHYSHRGRAAKQLLEKIGHVF
ncbi:non-canonical purine NTP pyrophosphatase, partial [Leuconostoc sp.]